MLKIGHEGGGSPLAIARSVAPGLGRGQDHHVLHVRVSLRHQSPPDRRQDPLHRGQPRPSGQPRRAVRQGRGRDHAALRAGAPDQAPEAGRRARRRRLCRDRVGRGAGSRDRVAAAHPRERPEKARVLHRARSEPGADRLVGEPVRHAQLRRARRLLLGQHGRGRVLYHRRLVLGVRRARLGAHPLLHAVRLRRGPRQQSAQDRAGQAEDARASSSSRSTRCAPATRPSPTSGWASAPAPTGCSCSRWCTSCCAPARSMSTT